MNPLDAVSEAYARLRYGQMCTVEGWVARSDGDAKAHHVFAYVRTREARPAAIRQGHVDTAYVDGQIAHLDDPLVMGLLDGLVSSMPGARLAHTAIYDYRLPEERRRAHLDAFNEDQRP